METIQGLEKQFPEQDHFITFISFNSLGLKLHHFCAPANKLNQIDASTYNPNACTPLYDAIGFVVNKLNQALENQTDYNVLVTILTDGAENSSKEVSGKQIKELVEELKQNRWTFSYIGTDHDVEKTAYTFSINNFMVFEKTEIGVRKMFKKEKMARTNYYRGIHNEKDQTKDIF